MTKIKTLDDRVKPLQDNICLEMISQERVTDSGIILLNAGTVTDKDEPEILKGKPLYGKVIAIGPGTYSKKGVLIPVSDEIKLGSIVFINKWGGTALTVDDKKYTLIRENEALFVTDEVY